MFKDKINMSSINKRSERNFGNCYFCGIKLDDTKTGVNNPDPLAIPNENGEISGCCYACDTRYVHSVRRVLWHQISKEEYVQLVPYVKIIPTRLLEEMIMSSSSSTSGLLPLIRGFKARCEQRGFKLDPEPMRALMNDKEYQKAEKSRLETARKQREMRALLDKDFDAWGPDITPFKKLIVTIKEALK